MSHKLVVIGDVLQDIDVRADASRLVPDAPAPVLDEQERATRPGGAALAALLAAHDPEVTVTLIAPVPDDDAGAQIRDALERASVHVIALPSRGKTPIKTRLRVRGQTVARLDAGGGVELLGVPDVALDAIKAADGILVSDYGGAAARHEVLRDSVIRSTAPTVWDPHPRGAIPTPGLALVTPNQGEALHAAGMHARGEPRAPVAAARMAADELLRRWAANSVCVTLGSSGALLAYGTGSSQYFPVVHPNAGDTCGAGDSFAASATTALAAGALPSEAVAAAVRAASAFIASGGVASLTSQSSVTRSEPAHAHETAEQVVARVRAAGGVVVATGGCFDLIHAGHIDTLMAARSLGDCLIVLLNSDASVRRAKGTARPLQNQDDRQRVLSALRSVDAVVIFDEPTPERALAQLRPDIWVKGGDYAGQQLPESDLVHSWGGEVVTVGYLDGRSTTNLIEAARR